MADRNGSIELSIEINNLVNMGLKVDHEFLHIGHVEESPETQLIKNKSNDLGYLHGD